MVAAALAAGHACSDSENSGKDGGGAAAGTGAAGGSGVAGSGVAGSGVGGSGTSGAAGSAAGTSGAAGTGGSADSSAGTGGSAGTGVDASAGSGGMSGSGGAAGSSDAGLDASEGSGGVVGNGGAAGSAGSGGPTNGCDGSSGAAGSGGLPSDAAIDSSTFAMCPFGDGAAPPVGSDGGPYAQQCASNDAGAVASCGPRWFGAGTDGPAALSCAAFCATLPGGPWQCAAKCDSKEFGWWGCCTYGCDGNAAEFERWVETTNYMFSGQGEDVSCGCGSTARGVTPEVQYFGYNTRIETSRHCCCEPAPCAADCTQCSSPGGSCQSQCPCPPGEYCSSEGNCCPLPQQVACVDLSGFVEEMQIVGNLLYATTRENGLHVLDISDPRSPVEVGSLDLPEISADLAVDGNTAYVVRKAPSVPCDTTVFVVDVSNPAAPSLAGSVGPPPTAAEDWKGVTARGGTLYAVHRGGMQIFDVSNPASPVAQGFWPTAGYVNNRSEDVAVIGNVAHVAVTWYSLYEVDVTNPGAPVEIRGGEVHFEYHPKKIEVADGERFVASSGPFGFDPPSLGRSVQGGFADVAVSEDAIYLIGGTLTVIDRAAVHPVDLADYDIQGNDIEVSGDHLFVAQGDQGIAVYRHTLCR